MAAQFCPKPLVLYADLNPGYPAMVGMLANAGSLDQTGIPFYKIFGELANKEIYGRLKAAILGISAFNRLKGLSYVHVGGRSLSIDTAVADPALWMQKFGIDVDHVDQMELVRRAEIELASPAKVNKAMDYLKKHVKKIHYTAADAKMKNTEELTRRAVALYYGMISLIEEFGYDFCRHQGSARAHRALRHLRHCRGVPERLLRARRHGA